MHREVITKEGSVLWPKFVQLSDFYLAGGTAVALQLGHRLSVDFDFFQGGPLSVELLPTIEDLFSDQPQRVVVNNSEELTLLIGDTKLTFLAYPFPLLYPTILVEGVKLATIVELAAMKAYTIGRRGSFKDYFDLYSMLKSGCDLAVVISDAEKKYSDNFNARLFLEQLVDLKDISDTALRFLSPPASLQEVEQFLSAAILKLKL